MDSDAPFWLGPIEKTPLAVIPAFGSWSLAPPLAPPLPRPLPPRPLSPPRPRPRSEPLNVLLGGGITAGTLQEDEQITATRRVVGQRALWEAEERPHPLESENRTHGSRFRMGTTGLKIIFGLEPAGAEGLVGLTVLGMMTGAEDGPAAGGGGGGCSAMARVQT